MVKAKVQNVLLCEQGEHEQPNRNDASSHPFACGDCRISKWLYDREQPVAGQQDQGEDRDEHASEERYVAEGLENRPVLIGQHGCSEGDAEEPDE